MITIQSLTKAYTKRGSPAVDSLSFEVNDGEIVGFVGLNGAGKTTTIRVAVGLSFPTSGTVSIDGHDIVQQKADASNLLGWVPEFPNFEPNARAHSLMQYFAGFYGIGSESASTKSEKLLEQVGLAGAKRKKLREYSQGMKKRFALAASMLNDPKNFLFDEVLNGLDPEGIRFFRQLMLDFRKQGKAVLLSSHILTEVENIADRVVIIHRGRLVKIIRSSELAAVGGVTIRIIAKDIDERGLEYVRGIGEVRTEGEAILLSSPREEPAKINAELIKMGYSVTEFTLQKQALEDYFLKLVGEGGS